MKKNIHPHYKNLKVLMTTGEEFITGSTYPGETLLLDIDFREHPAWKGGVATINSKANQVASFNKKFGNFFNAVKA